MKPGKIIFQGKTDQGFEILIRYPTLDDLKNLLDYINTLSLEQTYITFQGEQQSLQDEKKYLVSQLKKIKNKEAVKLLAFFDNKLIAVSDITQYEKNSSHVGTFGITVAQEFRNKGIGKLLMQSVLQEAKKSIKNLRIISLGVFANNPFAQKMYEKFGFKEYGRLPEGIKHKNKFVDHIFMFKKINE